MQRRVERINTHEGISVKALLDNGAIGLFMSKKYTQRGGFKLIKLEKPILVKNVDVINCLPEPKIVRLDGWEE